MGIWAGRNLSRHCLKSFTQLMYEKTRLMSLLRLRWEKSMVDEYYQKFMEYMRFCHEDVPTKGKNMRCFKLGRTFENSKACRERQL